MEKKAEASEKQGEKKDENKTSGKDDKKTEKHMMKPWGWWTKKRKKLLSLSKKGKRKLHKAALHKAALLPNRKVLLPVRQNLTQNIAGKRKSQKERSSRKKSKQRSSKKTTKLPGSGGEGWALGKRAKSTKKEREAG